jgi:hypothetical protein
MPAMTSAVVAVAGLGLSIGQMVHQTNLKKQAEAAGAAASARLGGIQEVNKLAALQVPTDDTKEQFLERQLATLVPTIQQDARTALGGAPVLMQKGADARQKISAENEKKKITRDLAVLGEDAAIEKREAERRAKLEEANITGAGLAARDADEAKASAMESAMGSATALGQEITKLGDQGYFGDEELLVLEEDHTKYG